MRLCVCVCEGQTVLSLCVAEHAGVACGIASRSSGVTVSRAQRMLEFIVHLWCFPSLFILLFPIDFCNESIINSKYNFLRYIWWYSVLYLINRHIVIQSQIWIVLKPSIYAFGRHFYPYLSCTVCVFSLIVHVKGFVSLCLRLSAQHMLTWCIRGQICKMDVF